MIRDAVSADIMTIVNLSKKFYIETAYSALTDFNKVTVINLVDKLINNGVLLVAEDDGKVVGMVGLALSDFLFDSKKTVASEIIWWVEPEAQGRGIGKQLLESVFPACIAKGADWVVMADLPNSPPQARKLYESLGYIHSENNYTKAA